MKLVKEDREVVRHGTSKERAFFIDGSAQMFKLLSDKLYSDKILAVIRELSCNAKDSHIDAGKGDVPFEIHLPNSLEPWFAVTDYGIGLSNDDILDMYTGYGTSTKANSNKVTGCFGVGSKSPFAYVDSFTVESRWEGKLSLFSCFYDEGGIPTIAMMGDPMDTTESTGITIKMASMESDIREFAVKATKALNRFDPAPIVTGNTDYEIKTLEYMVTGNGWSMLKSAYSYGDSNIHAIQGNVTYPISRHSLGDLTDEQNAVMNLLVDLHFDIGELDVAANREALGYDETTIANIKAKLDVVAKEISPLFQDKFKDCKTLWDARVLYNEVIKELPHGLQRILSDQKVGLKWKKQSVSTHFTLAKTDIDTSIVQFQRGSRGNRGQFVDYGYDNEIKFKADENTLFFYDDVGHGSHSRLTHFIETHDDSKRLHFLLKTDNRKLLKKFSKAIGSVTVQPISNLEKRPKQVRSARRVTSKVLEYTGQSHDRRDSWTPTDLVLNKSGGIYVMINRFKVYDTRDDVSGSGQHDREISSFDTVVENAKTNNVIDLSGKPIYGIRKGDISKIVDNKKWVNLFDLIRDKLAVVVKKEKVAQIMADRETYADFSCEIINFLASIDRKKFAKKTAIGKFLTAVDYMSNRDTDRARAISDVATRVGFTFTDGKSNYDLDELWLAVERAYPLVGLMTDHSLRGGYYRDTEKQKKNYDALNDYIKMIDNGLVSATPAKAKLKTAA